MENAQITIRLTADEALVFSDWLERVQMTDLGRVVDDPAVWAPIHRLAGTLDTALPEIFASDYGERLDAARRRLRESMGDFGLLPSLDAGPCRDVPDHEIS
ncbi:hypothetical protein [Streptomyces chattanoogensis]|uniref:Uncharacterized protein n=1 Tax=Streptomyces chattanoogensis TaxID=66876 RepID=A0A0N0Y003_9ACTN|nr:hypothetical protein [Streptomyces chattanoogensis]KPC64457.1 hypothetical protein ADL29_11215 [Streptomyces chattanoogensis]